AIARPPETSICAASAAQASTKLAATTAAPKISSAATGSTCRPTIRTTTAGTMNIAVLIAERVNVRRGERDAVAAGAAGLPVASIVILRSGVPIIGRASARGPGELLYQVTRFCLCHARCGYAS